MAEPGEGKPEQDDWSFLRTDDMVCLTCTVNTVRDSTSSGERVCLAAEGFGNRQCFLENISDKNNPPDISTCAMIIEQALSVRALQEMVTASSPDTGTQSGHRTLLYGHAVLLRHSNSNMYLACLSTSSSNDKLAFDVGLQEHSQGEACWWTIHPASKQRSEGEKVRVGDDLILVSVATERYLHTVVSKSGAAQVIASFHSTLFTVVPVGSGGIRAKSVGFVFGSDVLRLFHGHMDECLTIAPSWSEDPQHNLVVYETGEVCNQARSIWRLELIRTKWAGCFVGWGNPFRLRHITTGRYMSVTPDGQVILVEREKADVESTAFLLKSSKDDKKHGMDEKEEEGMGTALIKYGDSMVFVQHSHTGLWLSYAALESKMKSLGRVEMKKAVMLVEGHMDDGLTVSRSQEEESRSARVIRKCASLFHKFIRGLDALQSDGRMSLHWRRINLDQMIKCLEDLIEYFVQPDENTEHEEKQNKLRALRNRQDLFQEEGILTLILETIDKLSSFGNQGYFIALAGEEQGQSFDEISSYLYLLLAAMIKGNHSNCAQFAQASRLDWLFNRLLSQQASEGVLDVLHCVLIDSPEALNMIKEEHIKAIISLLDKHGRDPQVLDVLCSLCVGNGVAVRSCQNHICDNLLPGRDLLLQTQLIDHVSSMRPNVYVGLNESSAMYRKWYFEAIIDHLETVTHMEPHIRVGWANTIGYMPYPGGGEKWGGNGVGDDMYSYGFDGVHMWSGGKCTKVRNIAINTFNKNDVIGCTLDLTVPSITFSVNGVPVRGIFKNFNTDGMFFPVISLSAKVSCRFMLGGDHGRLKHGPPEGHSPLFEALLPKDVLRIEPCFNFGDVPKNIIFGPVTFQEASAFVPNPFDTSGVTLPNYIANVRDKLAENIHELWAMSKIEAGWIFGERRDDTRRRHPCLTTFEKLPLAEKKYDITLAMETLKTFLSLGYHIRVDKPPGRIKVVKLPNTYMQPNGYKPAPLDLSGITLNSKLEGLVDMLAENTHNVWAKERINNGWTYGVCEDSQSKRSPYLVPYNKVDEVIKKSNRDTASETVRTLIAYGYNLEPPTGEISESGTSGLTREVSMQKLNTRTYRAEKTYAVTEGKWYFEFEVLTAGYMKVGWAHTNLPPGIEIGCDETSFAYDGFLARKWHAGSEAYGKTWNVGDVVGCMLDSHDRTINFTLNGEEMMDGGSGSETAFDNILIEDGFVPACTLGVGQRAKLNFGQDVDTLKYFTNCGLQEGYEPFCVNMNKNLTLWYNKEKASFRPIDDGHPRIEVTRIPSSSETPPSLKITHKLFGATDKANIEFLRLSLPVSCNNTFMTLAEKDQKRLEIRNRKRFEKLEEEAFRRGKLEDHMLNSGFSEADIKDLQRSYSIDAVESPKRNPNILNPNTTADQLIIPEQGANLSRRPSMKKTQSFDTGIKAAETIQVPNGLPDPGKLRVSSSEEGLINNEINAQKNKANTLDGKIVSSKKRSKSPFKFLSRKIREGSPKDKLKDISQKGKDSVLIKSSSIDVPPERSKPLTASHAVLTSIPTTNNRLNQINENSTMLKITRSPDDPSSMQLLIPKPLSSSSRRPSSSDLNKPDKSPKLARFNSSYGEDSVDNSPPLENDEIIDEYFYGVKIFPGQDPNNVYVGWVTTDYHYHDTHFDTNKIRKATITSFEIDDNVKESYIRQNCYMLNAGEMQTQQSQQDSTRRAVSPGCLVGCFIDTARGILTFTINGREVSQRFFVERGTKLFPAVFVEATSKEILQFELGQTKNTLPLSAALFKRDKHTEPQCPPRLRLQTLEQHQWARVPSHCLKVHTLKLSDIRGWSMLCEDPVSMLALHLPEENKCIDILELIEHEDLLNFHAHSLSLYCAVCFNGNHRVAHYLINHVDQKQLMYCLQCPYLSGPLRKGFHDLLIAIHLEAHANSRAMTHMEFIIPVTKDTKRTDFFNMDGGHITSKKILRQISNNTAVSIRPKMIVNEIREVIYRASVEGIVVYLSTPQFPLDILKQNVVDGLADAVKKSVAHCRDPIGGTNENLFVPLLKLVDKLLLIGLLTDHDLERLLILIDPITFDEKYDGTARGLLQIHLDERVKLQICYVFHTLCHNFLRNRVESLISFSYNYVGDVQSDQLRRYIEIKQADLPSAIAAKKTREFRCNPKEQMTALLAFKEEDEEKALSGIDPVNDELQDVLLNFHTNLVDHVAAFREEAVGEEAPKPSWKDKLFSIIGLIKKGDAEHSDQSLENMPIKDPFKHMIVKTMIHWAEESSIESQDLIREMFSLLHRQYNGFGELVKAMEKAYVISTSSINDVANLLQSLGKIRSLLSVQMGAEEEELMRHSLWKLMNNKVFFQHPDLMRILCVHENVMTVMINTLGKTQQQTSAGSTGTATAGPQESTQASQVALNSNPVKKDTSTEMVVACCKFLCYFCRTGRHNQRAMFDHLSYLLENSHMLLARPSLRGSAPLDVAYSSLMDNNELALALKEQHLEKVAGYMSRCGLQSNAELLAKGYPDLGWDPVEGERYLDFLRFCVWVNGESVEENSNLVIRLLIRRPECLGPALRGEGGGLLKAIKDALKMSEQIAQQKNAQNEGNPTTPEMPLPNEEDEDYIDIGNAILNFYTVLVDLLGRCAPDAANITQGKSDCIRARAILRSLVSMEDLEGVLGLRFVVPNFDAPKDEGGEAKPADIPPGLQPIHKQAILLFLERVYGIDDQETFFRLLEYGFLPDLRATTMLDSAAAAESDLALALNRYLCNFVLPLLSGHSKFFSDAEQYSSLTEATLHTAYRYTKGKSLTKGQREGLSDFLVALTREMHPSMMIRLLRKLSVDVTVLTEYTTVALRLLTLHYERCGRYYSVGGTLGSSSEEEKRLTMMLFTGIFDSLAKREYDPELFGKALPCLSAIGCALSPDYSLTFDADDEWYKHHLSDTQGPYRPEPVDTAGFNLNQDLQSMVLKFTEHYHDAWAHRKYEGGWSYGEFYNDEKKLHPRLKPIELLSDWEKEKYKEPIRESLKALMAWGYTIERSESESSRAPGKSLKRPPSKTSLVDGDSPHGYNPKPVDMSTLTLSRELQNMAERLSENTHDLWAKKMKEELAATGSGVHPQLVPYDLLTDKEKHKNRERSQELLKYIQYQGYKIHRDDNTCVTRYRVKPSDIDAATATSSMDKRFAYSLLEKLLQYLDGAAANMKQIKPSGQYSRKHSYKQSSRDVKFFGKVVLPLVEKYFHAHRGYFLSSASSTTNTHGTASGKEKEMTASLFCKLAFLLRQKLTVFGSDARVSVRCLQVLVQAMDIRSLVKSSPDFVRTSLMSFFNNAAEDLTQTVFNLKNGRYTQIRGSTMKTSSSLNYVHLVCLPVLTALFYHLGVNNFGSDLLLGDIQLACYKILNALFVLGVEGTLFSERQSIKSELDRHRPVLGACLGAFSSTFPVAYLEPHLNKHNQYSIHGHIEDQSLEAQDVMSRLAASMPSLENIMQQVEDLAKSGGDYNKAPQVIDVILPMLTSYLAFWWQQGPDNVNLQQGNHVSMVTSEQVNNVFGSVLSLIRSNIGAENAPWMTRIAACTQPIIANSTADLLQEHILPLANKCKDRMEHAYKDEENLKQIYKSTDDDLSSLESALMDDFQVLVRDVYTFYPLLIKYVDLHRTHWLKHPSADAEKLYEYVAELFTFWSKSQVFKREEQNFISQNEIDSAAMSFKVDSGKKGKKVKKEKKDRSRDKEKDSQSSSMVACLKRMLPIGLNLFGGREQELVQHAKEQFLKGVNDTEVEVYIKTELNLPDTFDPTDKNSWQHHLYSKIGKKKVDVEPGGEEVEQQVIIDKLMNMAKTLFGLHLVDHPPQSSTSTWRKLVSTQRKRAVIACFRMVSLHSLPRHKAINLFLRSYCDRWLNYENHGQEVLINDLTPTQEKGDTGTKKEGGEEEEKTNSLTQLVTAFCRAATTEQSGSLTEDPLYMAYAEIMSKSCSGSDEDDDEEEGDGDDDAGASFQEQEMEKQKLLSEQGRLADCGVAEMALLHISASKGVMSPMVTCTLELGISLLRGGNTDVQKRILKHLKDKKDVGFFTSVAGLMTTCSVLNLDAFERCIKAEGLGVGSEGTACEKNLQDADFTCALFRLLQLLCEGHNLEFQNYLRTQAGNTTTVNIIICTVDYLLRLQESIMDFYWHYSSKEVVDQAGKENFCRAIKVAKQVFRTLTEYIQGPCPLNQLALAHSRLWDAVGGFFFLFAHMQDKLSKNSSQLELLREFLKLQKEMVIMMLSMLEGNVLNGPIGKQMVDTLVESYQNVEMILKFFDMFLKLKDLTSSPAFQEFDIHKDGWIYPKDFQKAMENQKIYTAEEITYLMLCADTSGDGRIDYMEFTERFHNPAKDIGFNLAVLLTNLSEHIPNDPRLMRLLEFSSSMLEYFQPYLGRIEILGSSKRIERVYFEIKESNLTQWEKPQIKESKQAFLYSVVNEGGEKEKLEQFVNFCEDAIFEMQHAASISVEEENDPRLARKEKKSSEEGSSRSILEPIKAGISSTKNAFSTFLTNFTPQNVKKRWRLIKQMTYWQMFVGLIKLNFSTFFSMLWFIYFVFRTACKFVMNMMYGQSLEKQPEPEEEKQLVPVKTLALTKSPYASLDNYPTEPGVGPAPVSAFGIAIARPDDGTKPLMSITPALGDATPQSSFETSEDQPSSGESIDRTEPPMEKPIELTDGIAVEPAETPTSKSETIPETVETKESTTVAVDKSEAPQSSPYSSMADTSIMNGAVVGASIPKPEPKAKEEEPEEKSGYKLTVNNVLSVFARNFYTLKYVALVLAFFINFILLFYKVTTLDDDKDEEESEAIIEAATEMVETLMNGEEVEGEEPPDPDEFVILEENFYYLLPIIQIIGLLHSLVSFSLLIAYYHLKVPLAIFKREKEISRKLEFDGMWITEQPSEDDIRCHWDKLVISTRSFPENYWDKFVKKKVRNKYSETHDYDAISNLLGMDKGEGVQMAPTGTSFLMSIDWKYQVWKSGVIFTDNSFLYILWYFIFSVLGNFNHFFFAAHLLDVAIGFKTLRTIMQSVTHNGKQLLLTVMMTTIVVYLYTVIAFNFFRKFYVQEEDEQVDLKCHSMMTCFVFHLYKGVRAGGGIGDEIEAPDGDDYEMYRIIFDITFFFFVIVILLAIIQGLIIDAFGELRDQLEQVKEDMESKCFICGMGKEYFDKVPHGFETHTFNEHNLANYLFFLMHLINKPDTEHTGQETFVWELYQQRCWDFFPVGDCFRKQYEDELMAA